MGENRVLAYADARSDRTGASPGIFLFLLSLFITTSPRIQLPIEGVGRPFELRLQDLLVAFGVTYLVLHLSTRWPAKLRQPAGAIVVAALLTTTVAAISLLGNPSLPLIRALAFHGRFLETLTVVLLVTALVAMAPGAARSAAAGLLAGGIANLVWVLLQSTMLGARGPLLVSAEDAYFVYGASGIGEASPLAVGTILALVLIVLLVRGARPKWMKIWMVAPTVALVASGLLIVQSRAAIAGSLAAVGVLMFVRLRRAPALIMTVTGLAGAGLISLIIQSELQLQLARRYSLEGIAGSLGVRTEFVWSQAYALVSDRPFIGHGPGALGHAADITEAHNMGLRWAIDYGAPAAVVLLLLVTIGMVRILRAAMAADAEDVENRIAQPRGALLLSGASLAYFVVAGATQDALTAAVPSHLAALSLGIGLGSLCQD